MNRPGRLGGGEQVAKAAAGRRETGVWGYSPAREFLYTPPLPNFAILELLLTPSLEV